MEFKLFLQFSFLIWMSFTYSLNTFAHHPNEGTVTLSYILEEAHKNNTEIKEAQIQLESTSALKKRTISGYLPQVSLNGSYQGSKFDAEKSNGALIHGTATLNLYRGGKDSALRESQSKEEDFQKIKSEKIKSKIDREITKLYYELLFYQEGIALKEQALEANKIQMNLALKKKMAGYTSQADVLEFELREATLKSDTNFLKREETVKEREIGRLTGKTEVELIRVSGHLERMTFSKSSQELLRRALSEREDIKESEKNLALSELGYKSLLGDYLPRVDLEGKYGKLGNEERIFNQTNNYTAALKISIPIFSGFDTVYAREAKVKEVAKNDLATSRLKLEVKVQLENALTKLKSVDERLDLEEKNIERSKQYYEITLSEYKRGVKNSPDVAGAAERLFDSRLRNLEYRKDYYVTWLEIAEAVGVSSLEL